ncbi:MAG TPA: hypothetical protein VGO61_11830 [Steroidobacteraceae bacterium]|jgi:uncharacterized membrane protein|nr:hypothetical protein [Steroidobacteraceae bacterium]
MIAIGLASLVYGNDSFLWYTIPLMPGSALLVYLCGLVALASGIGLLLPPYLLRACRILVAYLGLWLVVLKLTSLLASPGEMMRWESCGETMAMLAGALCLLAMHAGEWEKKRVPFLVGERGIRIARYLAVAALVTFGLAHFAYADRTASLVPRWLPFPLFWVYLTGIANITAAAGMLLGFYPRLAATLAAAMLWAFTLLVWIPRVTSAPSDQGNWTEWILSAGIAAGSWLVAETWRGEPWKVRRSF